MNKNCILILLISMCILYNNTIRAQQMNLSHYTFTHNNNGSLFDMTNADTLIHSGVDNMISDTYVLPFVFAFNGSMHNSVAVSTRGIAYLSPSLNNFYFQMGALPVSPTGLGSAWNGKEMGTHSTGAIVAKTFGTKPYRNFVIGFQNMSLSKRTDQADASFQVVLSETTGAVNFIYGHINLSDTMNVNGPHLRYTPNESVLMVNTNNNTTTYTTNQYFYEGGATMPGILSNVHSPTEGNRKIYTFTPTVIDSFEDSTLNIYQITSGLAVLDLPYVSSGYTFLCAIAPEQDGPYSNLSPLTNNLITGKPDSTIHVRVYLSNGGAITSNYLYTPITFGSARTFTSIGSGFWGSPDVWDLGGGNIPAPGDSIYINMGDTIRLSGFSLHVADYVNVAGVLDYYQSSASPLTVDQLHIQTGGLVRVHNASTAFNAASIVGKTLIVSGDITGNGILDMRYRDCLLEFQYRQQYKEHILDINFQTNAAGTPILSGLKVATTGNIHISKPLTISKQIISEYGTIVTQNNLTLDRLAVDNTQIPNSEFVIHRYYRGQLFDGTVQWGSTTTPDLYYHRNRVMFKRDSSNYITTFTVGQEIPPSNTVNQLHVYTYKGIDVNRPLVVNSNLNLNFGIINMINNDDFTNDNFNLNYLGGGVNTQGWFKTRVLSSIYTAHATEPGTDAQIFPILSNGKKRFAYLKGALSTSGLYGVRHIDLGGTSPLTTNYTEEGYTFGNRSNAYWNVTGPNNTAFTNAVLHFRVGELDATENFEQAGICYENNAAFGSHVLQSGIGSGKFITRTGLTSTNIENENFYVSLAGFAPLPLNDVQLEGFNALNKNILTWPSLKDKQYIELALEKSQDAVHFYPIYEQKLGLNKAIKKYEDQYDIEGKHFYRLKAIKESDEILYSNTIALEQTTNDRFITIAPNPAQSELHIEWKNANITHIEILDIKGVKINSIPVNTPQNKAIINTQVLQAGVYLIQLYNNSLLLESKKFMKVN
jgi:hypothetical protein